ncbi:halotolerance protein [Phyllosticta citriasiana]|uniref:Halotolerance protein n=1 Tax=Phyllosticta citriasiana TaxID=595635 RepID=A0ABR1KCF6_9PEZI
MFAADIPRSNALSGPPLNAVALRNDNKAHLLLAASGSVATIKIPLIIGALSKYPNLSIRLVLTSSAAAFLAGQSAEQPNLETIASMPNVDGIYLDEDEWKEPWVRGNNILHIELRRWADLLVVAPLSANSLGKMVNGLCDNLLLSTIRAWDTTGTVDPVSDGFDAEGQPVLRPRKKTIIVAPAMNTAMWNHPVTKKQVALLEGEWNVKNEGWVEVLRPIEKRMACGDTGSGGMKEWEEIVVVIEDRLELQSG